MNTIKEVVEDLLNNRQLTVDEAVDRPHVSAYSLIPIHTHKTKRVSSEKLLTRRFYWSE